MSDERTSVPVESTIPFNSALESGLRAICILYEAYPDSLDSQRLVFYDYLTVHSGDVDDGPDSLHPPTPFRANEWLVRRAVIDQGLRLLTSRGLVQVTPSDAGLLYCLSETAGAFVHCLTEEYTDQLRERAGWVVDKFSETSEASLVDYFNENLDRWGAEFQRIGEWEIDE